MVEIKKKVYLCSAKVRKMSTFLGHIDAKVDVKGRLFIPVAFRKAVNVSSFIVRRDIGNECLVFYPEVIWNKKVETLYASLNEWNATDNMLLMQFLSEAEQIEMDTQGRVLLTKKNLQLIGADKDVVFVGLYDRFALWSPEHLEAKKLDSVTFADQIQLKMCRKDE